MRVFDYGRLSERTWDSETLALVAQIHEYKGRQELFMSQKPVALDRLTEIAKIQSTEASNKIEGIVTTQARIKQLCGEKTTPRNRDEEEISGYRDVLKTIHESYEFIPLTSNYILQLHGMLFHYSARDIGGRYKNVQNYIEELREDGTSFVRFTPLAPYETPDAIKTICESYNRTIDNAIIDPLILIPVFICDFLCIHPFNDGNGRMSRLLTTLLLYRSGYAVGKYVSLEAKIERNKEAYYACLQAISTGWADAADDPTAFVKFFLGIVLSAYRDFEERTSLIHEKVPALALVRKAVKSKVGKFTKNDIMELCPAIGKSSVEGALRKLIELGEVARHGDGKNTFYTRAEI